MDDRQLVAGVTRRDPEAFRTLMERNASLVINLAYRFLGTVADAEDVAQDVFLRLYQNPPHLAPEGKLSTWLYRVTANRCIDLLRSKPRQEAVSIEGTPHGEEEGVSSLAQQLPDSKAGPRELVAQSELGILTRRAVAALPISLRGPLLLSAFEGISLQEIGEIFSISSKAAERRIARAREILRARLQPYL